MAQHSTSAPTAHHSRLGRRLGQLFAGLMLYGASMALLIRSQLGNTPWDVLHQGLARQLDVSIGTIVIAVGVVVLLLWIPLREKPGFGTISNVVVIGLAVDATLAVLPVTGSLPVRVLLGAGPRDGLMTGLVHRTGGSVRRVRTVIEVGVVAIGWLLGGTLGGTTVLYALAIGPLVQLFLPRLTVPGGVTGPAVTLGTSAGPGRKPIGRGQS